MLTDWATGDRRQQRAIRNHILLALKHSREMGFGSIYAPLDDSERIVGIYYAKIRGNPPLRPRLCLGPERPNDEITYLARAEERGGKIAPALASQQAEKRRAAITRNPRRRKRITTRRLWR